jgi:sulfite exporter TauE/SafE
MSATGFVAVFLVGLLGGVHCIGMCGGIVSALTVQLPGDRKANWPLHLAYNVGRITSYTLAGAVMGSVGSLGLLLNNLLPIQMTLYVGANVMLLALGAYLTGATRTLAFTEKIGQRLWLHLQPATRWFLPVRRISQAFPLGMLWGWLPCGMVYSVLAMALMSGSAQRGAATMLVFGLGTLPNLMLAGLLLKRLRGIAQARWVRVGAGVIVFGFGVFGLIYAPTLGGNLWNGIVCKV